MEIIQKLLGLISQAQPIIGALDAVILALIALFLLIPGEQPEKALRSVAALLEKISKK